MGLDPWPVVDSHDRTLLDVGDAIALSAAKHQLDRDKRLAQLLANELAKRMR